MNSMKTTQPGAMQSGATQPKSPQPQKTQPKKLRLPGMLKGLGVTARTMLRTLFPDGLRKPVPQPSKGAHTVQYPHEKEAPAPRARGVIALHTENCTACMLCARECPDWCIYIEAHKALAPPRRAGGKPRQRNILDRFDIDYSLCMYCGICVEVCPFEALFWSPEYEYSEAHIADLLHDKERLSDWMETVPEFEDYESGSEQKKLKVPEPVERVNPLAATPRDEEAAGR